MSLRIGELAERGEVNLYYEREGLLPEPSRLPLRFRSIRTGGGPASWAMWRRAVTALVIDGSLRPAAPQTFERQRFALRGSGYRYSATVHGEVIFPKGGE